MKYNKPPGPGGFKLTYWKPIILILLQQRRWNLPKDRGDYSRIRLLALMFSQVLFWLWRWVLRALVRIRIFQFSICMVRLLALHKVLSRQYGVQLCLGAEFLFPQILQLQPFAFLDLVWSTDYRDVLFTFKISWFHKITYHFLTPFHGFHRCEDLKFNKCWFWSTTHWALFWCLFFSCITTHWTNVDFLSFIVLSCVYKLKRFLIHFSVNFFRLQRIVCADLCFFSPCNFAVSL